MAAGELVAALGRGALCAKQDTLVVALFDHAMRQTHGVEWARMFVFSHHRPLGEAARLARYVDDRMIEPPPAIVRAPEV